MRISDWSSDVCSSDLVAAERARRLGLVHPRRHPSRQAAGARAAALPPALRDGAGGLEGSDDEADRPEHRALLRPGQLRPRLRRPRRDRQRVVEGKSVSDRVALGGSRLINKKTKKNTIQP